MTSEALQNPYFVRLYCISILTKHICNNKIVKIGPHCSRPEVPTGWDRDGVSLSPQVEGKWK